MIKINVLKNKNQKASSQNASLPVSNEKKNKGGLLGGLGYVGGSIAAGVGGVAEGVTDVLLALGADITGDHNYAEYVFKDNVVGDWHEELTNDFNPGTGWKFAGDVGSGIGQSATLFIPYAGAPLFFAGVMSQGISGAAEKTGDVGLKEVAYGVTTGAIEGTLEMALGAAGKGAKSIASSAAKSLGKNSVKGLAKSAVRRGVAGKLLSGAAGEFVEEAISEAIDPMIQRLYQIDPNASTSMKDVLYAGLVGAVSGAVTTGAVEIPKSASNRARGAKVIRNGNSQTLVNNATILAERLAGAGTDFKNAPEWVRTLRGEIDAYNELVKKGKQNSASAETILGEMQASVGFAEMQAINAGITAKIKSASEADRAALAEYINMTVDAKNRPKTYTAEDIAKDTDGVATQLAIMEFAGSAFDIDGAMDVSGDVAQESAIASVIAEESGKAASAEGRVPSETQSETDPVFEQAMARAEAPAAEVANTPINTASAKTKVSKGVPVAGETSFVQDADVSAPSRRAPIENTYEDGVESLPYSGVPEAAPGTYPSVEQLDIESRERKYKLTKDGREVLPDSGAPEPPGSAYPSIQKQVLEEMTVTDAERAEARARTEKAAKFEQETAEASKKAVESKAQEKGAEAKNKAEAAKKSSEGTNKSTESKKSEPKTSKPKESYTAEQIKEKARKRAEQWIEWEKNTRPTAKELNTVREYVKGFDNLSNPRRLAIIRTIRSAKGVDAKIVKGVANLMAIKAGADLEIRFDEKISNEGVTVPMGDKTLILIGTSTDFKKTIKGTIAHELVHYLERKPGYQAFAEHVMKHVKPEVRSKVEAEVTKDYNEFYTERYRAELEKQGLSGKKLDKAVKDKLASAEHKALIDSEVVANLVGRALDNEKFLSRYARIGNNDGFIKRAYSFLRGMVKELKSRGEESEEARELADIIMPTIKSMDRLLQQGNAKEGVSWEKKYAEATPEQIAEWEKPITLHDVEVLRSIGQKSINAFSSDEIKKAQKWAYKFYKELGVKSPFFRAWFGEWRAYDTSAANIVAFAYGEKGTLNLKKRSVYSPELKKNIIVDDNILEDSYHYANINGDKKPIKKLLGKIDEILASAILLDTKISNDNSGNKKGSTQFMHYLYAPVSINGAPFIAKLTVEEYDLTGKVRTYNLQRIELSDLSRAQYSQMIENNREKYAYKSDALSVAQLYEFVKSEDEKFSPAPEVSKYSLNADGTPKRFYHGTNQGEFYEFLWSKTQRADGGFFGRGHYFTASKSMANLYGKRIVEAYLSFKNPFIWSEQINTRDGNRGSNIIASNLIKLINMARVFPSLFEKKKIRAAIYDSNTGEYVDASLRWSELEAKIEEAETTLHLQKFADGTYQWFAPGRFWDEGVGDRYSSVEKAEADKFSAAAIAFSNKYEGVVQSMSFDDQSTYTQQYGDEITKLLISMNYDASMQNPEGDEVVIFEPSKIKSATDNIGTFDKNNPDIRYSLSKKNAGSQTKNDAETYEKKYSIAKKNGGKKKPKETARKSATVASEYAGRYAGSFRLNSAARKKVEEELEGIENDFVKGGEGYTEKYQKRVRRIWETIKTYGSFELISEDEKFREFSRYMFRKKFRVDKRFREEMGAEWKELYKALRGRIAADTNTKYSHIDTFYAELSEQFPDMFPEDIVNIHDQLDRIAKIIGESKNSPTSEFTYDQLPDEMQAAVTVDVIDMINSFVTKIASNRDVVNRLKKENEALVKRTLSMRNNLARERAENAKAENAQVFAKKDVKIAVDSIEGWTQDEVLSLAKGQELQGMSRAKREEMISQIYVALHEEGAKGRVGPGSVAVKTFAAEIANDYLDSAQIKGADGKSVHLSEIYDELSINRFKQELTDLLYGEFANMGQTTQNAEFQAIIRAQKESFLQDQLNDKLIGKETRNLAYQGKKLRELVENQKRDGAAEDISKVTKKLAAVVDAKGNIRVNAVDEAMKEASRFFDAEKMKAESAKNMLKTSDGKETRALSDFAWEQNEELKFMIDEYVRLRRGREGRALSTEELKLAAEVLRGMKTTLERYNKEFINGHWVDVDEAAKACVADLTAAWRDKEYKNKAAEILGGTVDWFQEKYFYKILTPETVVETLEGYAKSGILKQLYHSIRVHKQRAEHLAVQMKKPLFEFIESKENDYTDDKGKKRSFRTKLNAKKISIDGADITLGEAIYLYMLTKREEAHAGLLENGYIVFDDKNQRRAAIAIPDIETVRSNIYNQLDKTDIEFLKLSEDFFNKTASKIKHDADMNIFGYTNIREGYYVPMIRDRYSRMNGVTDARQSIGSIITVYNKSFNQNLVENARALEGKNIMSIISDHADGLADYAELYLPLKAFDRTYNRAVGTSDGSIRSIREVLNNDVWNGTERYFKDLFADIQGQREQRDDVVNNLVGKIRSGWVNSVLGANLKVVATQTTSLVSATQVIGAKYIAKCSYLASPGKIPGLAEIRARAYEYSDIIEARSFDMGALKSQGNVDKINAIGEKTGWAIGWMDERICLAVFHAAELQIQDQQGYAVGTPENAERAARLADEAIYTTQAMSSASERSALQRSTSEIGKMLAMFTSDTVKNLSHLYGNINKWNAYKARVKSGDVSYEAEMKKAGKDIRRSVRTLACTGIMLGLIAQGFKYLYGREEEEPEDKQRDFIADIAGSTLNILPIVSDIADKLFFDYDMSLNVLDVANDTLEAVSGTFKMAGNAMKGEYVSTKQVTKNSVNLVKSVGSFFGLPITPVERTVSGLLRFVSPEAAYSYNSNFKAQSYTSDLQAAVESGDERIAEHVLEQLYRNEVAGVYTSAELEEIVRLFGLTDDDGKHYNVLPQKIGTEINGVVLNKAQRKQFEKVYSQASAEVNKLIRSEYYDDLSDEQRAKAIKNLYALYYNRAASEVTGKEWTQAQAYALLTDNYAALFASQAYKSGLEAVKDASGKEVTVKSQNEAYLKSLGLSDSDYVVISYANGMRSKSNRSALLAHINSLALSDEQKAKLAEALGFEVKNGKVVEKEE